MTKQQMCVDDYLFLDRKKDFISPTYAEYQWQLSIIFQNAIYRLRDFEADWQLIFT